VDAHRRLSYKEQRELETLPNKIESLEAEQSVLLDGMADADFYRQSGDKISLAMERLESLKRELEVCYERWQHLDSLSKAADG
jgi:ATP-binding cassette subfamily F protein uup